MRMVSALSAIGGAISGSDSGHCGNSNGSSLSGSSSVAPRTSSASSRNVRPSSGRIAGSSTTVFAVNSMRAFGFAGSAAYEKRTPCSVSGPDTGPSAFCHDKVAPAGRRATICASNASRPPAVVSNHHSRNTSATPTAIVPSADRIATLRANARRTAARSARCSGVSGTPLTGPPRC